ncbi:site-specific integrase [Streptomyces sp. PSAA01]|nr:site-specific integrase [Streptomyces sp. PSAA01]
MKGRGARTWKRYAYTLVVWLNFLQVFGKGWREATAQDVEAFKDWRLTDVRNDERIKAASFDTDRTALNTFYTWAWGKYGVQNPVSGIALASNSSGRSGQSVGPEGERRDGIRPTGSRGRQVKWMLRAPFEQWRDIGLRGYGFDGLRRVGWSGAERGPGCSLRRRAVRHGAAPPGVGQCPRCGDSAFRWRPSSARMVGGGMREGCQGGAVVSNSESGAAGDRGLYRPVGGVPDASDTPSPTARDLRKDPV